MNFVEYKKICINKHVYNLYAQVGKGKSWRKRGPLQRDFKDKKNSEVSIYTIR